MQRTLVAAGVDERHFLADNASGARDDRPGLEACLLDLRAGDRRLWVRLDEKGGKQHAMPCHHNLEAYLHEYIDGADLAREPKALLFQSYSRATGRLTGNPLAQANAYATIQRRAKAANIAPRVGNDTFRATGVTAYPKKWRHAGARRPDGEPCLDPYDAALSARG